MLVAIPGTPPNDDLVDDLSLQPEVRERRWIILRTVFKTISQPPYDRGSFRRALWNSNSIPPDAVPMGFFISMLIQEFGFERSLRMDLKLKQLFSCFKKHEKVDAIDAREVVCSFEILYKFRNSQHETRKFLDGFFETFARKAHFYERRDLLAAVSLAARTPEELGASRGELDRLISVHAPRYGLKPNCRQVTKVVAEEILEEYPSLVEEFRTQCWDRMTHDMRSTILKENIAHSQAIVESHELRIKLYKATMMWRSALLRKCFLTWHLFLEMRQKLHLQRSWMLEGYAIKACSHWHQWAIRRVGQRQRKYIATLMGEVRILRRFFVRLVKNWRNNNKIYWATILQSHSGKNFMLGAAKVRWAARRGGARLALRHWYEYSQMALALDIAEHIWTEALIRRVFLAFRDTMRLILRDRNLEADALQRQKEIAKMLADAEEEAEEIRKAEAFIVEKKQEYDKKVKEEQKRQEEEEKEAKRKEMKEEKNSIILAIQQDERRKRVDQQIADMFQNHREKWAATEVRELAAAEARYRAWLQTPEAASAIDREFKFLRRDFYAAPTPERQEREAQLKNLANIVFCNVSHKLFQDQLTLREFYDGVDESGDGFLDYEEFAALITALDINLSADQMRTVLQTVDDDESGFINFEEFEGAMEKVQGVCGLEGSPWRLYIEPAQAVLCYHNIETGEKILDYKMKDEKLKEINLDEMTAKEKIKIRKEINERKEKDWEDIMEHWAATTLQKLWWLHKGRQARAHKKMVDETREYRQERALKKAMAIRLQSWARVVASKQRARFRLQVTVERVWDPEHGRAFYFNHALGASSWEPPPQVVKLNTTLPDPIEWYQVKDEQGVLEFKNWKTGEISSKKPLGFPMCLACASTLATRNCRTCNLGYCFKCFRLAHNHAEYEGHAWEPMRPVLCSTCNKTPTQVRCKDCEKSFCKKCFERTHEDGTPKAGHSKINI